MSTKKRLGRGLEDISHLFLSRPSSAPAPGQRHPPTPVGMEVLQPATRVWLALSLVPRLPSAFFTANLIVELARAGKRVLAVETSPVPSLDDVLGTAPIHPSLSDLLEQPQKNITIEGPLGVKLLSFQLRLEEIQGFADEEQEILSQVLCREEEAADLLLIHAVYEETGAFRRWVGMVQGVILTVDLNSATLLETYQVCKYLFQLHPDLRIGINVFGLRDRETAAGMEKLNDAVGRFLGKSIEWHGMIPDDPLIERSMTAKVPLTVLAQSSKTASGFSAAAKHLLSGMEGRPNRTESADSFFGRLQPPADRVRE